MDFASILGAEIKKRKSASNTPTPDAPPAKKYLKRAELEAAREAEYRAEQARLERERAEKAEKKRQQELEEEAKREAVLEKKRKLAEESRRKREEEEQAKKAAVAAKRKEKDGTPGEEGGLGSEEGSKKGTPVEDEIPKDEEVFARLRALNQPIKLFGETPQQRFRRLRRLEADSGASTTSSRSSRSSTPKTPIPKIPMTEKEMRINLTDVTANRSKVYQQLDAWFRLVLREWDIALASRAQSIKTSYQGIAATSSYTQADQYMAPLFRHLQKQDLHPDIFPKVCEIVHEAQNRRYVNANHKYLELSIGNAAWPIGVTMVGIHERSAREKLHEKGMAAHIMSDEVTRKYLQSIKRCLRFCQTRWPPEDQLQVMG